MATLFAAQLRDIAANTTNELDLKAQRAAHSTSLIFEKKVAGGQDFDTIYQLCLEGFQDLCLLDPRFTEFSRSLFSVQSKTQDREQLTKDQNKELDSVIEAYLGLVGGRLLLKPAIKSVEWLVRRFRIHEYNTSFTILAFLPYYATPIFRNLLSILPPKVDPSFKFLYPYISSLTNPPRHAIAYSATNNDGFFAAFNSHVITVCEAGSGHERLLGFWTEIVVEALSGRVDLARSGRREIQEQREQDLLIKMLPTLSDALSLDASEDLMTSCYTIIMVLASRLSLAQKVTRSLMEAISISLSPQTMIPGTLALCVLLDHNKTVTVPKKVAGNFISDEACDGVLLQLNSNYSISAFVLALIETAMQGNQKHDSNVRLRFVERMLQLNVLEELQVERVATVVLQFLSVARATGGLATLPPRVNDLTTLALRKKDEAPVVQIPDSQPIQNERDSDVEMQDLPATVQDDTWEEILARLPTQTTTETTFMDSAPSSTLFQQLTNAFQVASSDDDLLKQFCALPVIRPTLKSTDPLFFSFLIRLTISQVSPQVLTAAWRSLGDYISDLSKPVDTQMFLPYAFTGLSNTSVKVRRQVAKTISQWANALSGLGKDHTVSPICSEGFYGETTGVKHLSNADSLKVIERIMLPILEECVSDPTQALRAINVSLSGVVGHVHPSKLESIELKKNTRTALFEYLLSHAARTPSYNVRTRLLSAVASLEKVGSVRKSAIMMPALEAWSSIDGDEARRYAQSEGLLAEEIDEAMFTVIGPTDKEALSAILSCLRTDSIATRPSLLDAASRRSQELWQQLSADRQISATTSLLDTALDTTPERRILSRFAKELLRTVPLSTDALAHILDQALGSVNALKDQPAAKRRRTSQEHSAILEVHSSELPEVLRRITFVLELIDGSSDAGSADLIHGLFQILASLQSLKATTHSELGYLLSLTLGCLLRIIDAARLSNTLGFDLSSARVDLVIECARVTDNPQVQNTALLLVASLASLAPEHVLHSVMPIFTFMGSNILKKDDDYSAHVINQTIDQIIPPLTTSLRKQKKDIVSGTSDLLLSFAAAFEHMPAHRRLGLFEVLIQRLGSGDTLHAMLAMLANRYPLSSDAQVFSTALATRFPVEVQLQSYRYYLDLVTDSLKPKPVYARALLGLSNEESEEAFKMAQNLISAISRLYNKSDLKKTMSKATRKDQTRAIAIRKEFSELLQRTLSLADSVATHEGLNQAANELLTALLNLLSISELVDVVQRLLERPADTLRTKTLRLLDSRLRGSVGKDTPTHVAVLALLPTLSQLLQQNVDVRLKYAAVACVDQIIEKLGRKDLSAISSTATVIAGPECLSSGDIKLSTMGLLCLSSIVEVLKDAIIPILPNLMKKVFELLEVSMQKGHETAQLHNACFALLSALLTHVPFMLSDVHIRSIFSAAFASANSNLDSECDGARKDALELLARGIDAKKLISAIEHTWTNAVQSGIGAVIEALTVIENTIDTKSKSAVTGNSEGLLELLLAAYDLRRTQLASTAEIHFTEEEIFEIESKTNGVMIKMIYKLNDTIFRPLFSRTVEWATKANDISKATPADISQRELTLFNFLTLFFSTLKSIVTSYATYILPTAVTILSSYSPSSSAATDSAFPLWSSVNSTLTFLFEHDADDFFAIPSHFNSLSTPLINQLHQLETPALLSRHLPLVLPCITNFATSLTSSSPHLKTLNQQICALRSSEHASVRLASVRVQAALTKELGEEWLANSGEMMVYIQRMLEDDDDKVERETREWVAEVQEVLGEDVGEMLQG